MSKEIPPDIKAILDKIRELYTEAGGKLWHSPEEWGVNEYFPSESGKIEVVFDYGMPLRLRTVEGECTILGSHRAGDTKKFWELFTRDLDIEILRPKRDDPQISYTEYQCNFSGPLVAIRQIEP